MPHATITEAAIRDMVDGFYAKVREDAELGPVFERTLAGRWDAHMPKMYDFWSAVLLTTGRFKGNPMQAHAQIPPFPEEMFGRWLFLFERTLDEVFTPEPAAVIAEKAHRIARSLRMGLYFRPAAPAMPRPGAVHTPR